VLVERRIADRGRRSAGEPGGAARPAWCPGWPRWRCWRAGRPRVSRWPAP